MSRARLFLVLVGVQVALLALYLGVESRRRPEAPFHWERLDLPAPALSGDVPVRPHLVHFWATWCAPCVEELPALIAATDASGVPLLAITDEPWPVVQRYFGGDVPPSIRRDPAAAAGWQVSGLPDTFAVRDGRVVARMGGPRDWTTTEARAFLSDLAP